MRPIYFALFASAAMLLGQGRGKTQTPPAPGQAVVQPPVSPVPSPRKGGEGSNAASLALLDAAIQKLSRPEGVDVRFRIEVFSRGEPVFTTGRSVTAPNKKVAIDLEARQVARTANSRMLCDGTRFYRIESLGDRHSLMTYTVKELQDSLDRLVTSEAERVAKEDVERLLQGRHGFEGVAAFVRDLRARMDFDAPQVTNTTINGKAAGVKLVEGHWSKDVLDFIAPPTKQDPNGPIPREMWDTKQAPYFDVPRVARLYFDSTTGDLLRVELLGIRYKQGPETILTVIHVDSIQPLAKVADDFFKPTAAELAYPKVEVNLQEMVRAQHQEMMRSLKSLQSAESQVTPGK